MLFHNTSILLDNVCIPFYGFSNRFYNVSNLSDSLAIRFYSLAILFGDLTILFDGLGVLFGSLAIPFHGIRFRIYTFSFHVDNMAMRSPNTLLFRLFFQNPFQCEQAFIH